MQTHTPQFHLSHTHTPFDMTGQDRLQSSSLIDSPFITLADYNNTQ